MSLSYSSIVDVARLEDLEWDDLAAAHRSAGVVLAELAAQPQTLRRMLEATRADAHLRSMCEVDEFRRKFVLVDSKSGFRLRLHVWQYGFADCVHSHRFSYVARLLHGGYQHTVYRHGGESFPAGIEQWVDAPMSSSQAMERFGVDVGKVTASSMFSVAAGQTYSQDNSLLSSTVTEPMTVSLFVRGPSVRPYSIQWYTDTDEVVWRAGAAHTAAERHQAVHLDDAGFDETLAMLEGIGVIAAAEDPGT